MKTATILIVIFFLLGFSHGTGSQPQKETITPPSVQVAPAETSAVYRLKAINDSASLAIESRDLNQTQSSWWTFQQLSKKLFAYSYKVRQMNERQKVVRDTVLKLVFVNESSDTKPPDPVVFPDPEVKKESWIKRLFKTIF